MSAAQSEAVIERLAGIRQERGAEDFAAYAFLALGILGWQAPDVLGFILDRADALATPTNTPPSAVTRDAAQGGATTSVPSSFGEGSGGTEASATRPAPGVNRDGT